MKTTTEGLYPFAASPTEPVDFNEFENIVSVSGGKDSTATLLIAIEKGVSNLSGVFADTGNEHESTIEYIEYLRQETGVNIVTVKADIAGRVIRKRETVRNKWVNEGIITPEEAEAICELLVPSGNPFLDICMEAGRFPSRMAQFCTRELKAKPIREQIFQPLIEAGREFISWQGVRRDESEARKNALVWEEKDDYFVYRPIVHWTAQMAIDYHARHGIKPNPLYSQGKDRVGCMPCINIGKEELRQVAERFPDHIKKIAVWEKIVSAVSRRKTATFFSTYRDPLIASDGILGMIEWAKTARGGRQFDLLAQMESPMCSSSYGLCE